MDHKQSDHKIKKIQKKLGKLDAIAKKKGILHVTTEALELHSRLMEFYHCGFGVVGEEAGVVAKMLETYETSYDMDLANKISKYRSDQAPEAVEKEELQTMIKEDRAALDSLEDQLSDVLCDVSEKMKRRKQIRQILSESYVFSNL